MAFKADDPVNRTDEMLQLYVGRTAGIWYDELQSSLLVWVEMVRKRAPVYFLCLN